MNYFKRLKKKYKETKKKSLLVYFTLRILVILCMILELLRGDLNNAFLCFLSLLLFTIPTFIEDKFKIGIPSLLESIIYIFIFSAEILGEINNFYGNIPYWDTMLHTINGFLAAGVGFSLVDLLNENSKNINLSPLYVAIVSFCFSMTIGVVWEFYEYGMDKYLNLDMQKDKYVYKIQTVTLDPKNDNNIVTINGIDHTILYDSNNNKLAELDGYLDIGIHDTMKDLLVNFIGAIVYSIFGYLYIIDHEKHQLAGKFITTKKKEV